MAISKGAMDRFLKGRRGGKTSTKGKSAGKMIKPATGKTYPGLKVK